MSRRDTYSVYRAAWAGAGLCEGKQVRPMQPEAAAPESGAAGWPAASDSPAAERKGRTKMKNACVHVYTGEGKGKTTAAVGLAVRAAGRGLRVGFLQFLKDGSSGEIQALEKLGVQVDAPAADGKFVFEMDEVEKAACAEKQRKIFDNAKKIAQSCDLLVLDEVICAVDCGLISEQELLKFVQEKPESLELVLTGRGASAALCAESEYVTEMRCLQHPYQQGMAARCGIEF